jgi:UDPglucose 6-dehydrogenase
MRVATIGSGYVGLVTGTCLADMGHSVTCVDVLDGKVEKINRGESPIFEENLENLIRKNINENLIATTDLEEAVSNSDVSFICVGTPSKNNGEIDLTYIKDVCKELGGLLRDLDYHLVVVKSSVVPGTTDSVILPLLEKNSGKKAGEFGVCVNPEFLREGKAVNDFMNPDRIVIGEYDKRSGDMLEELYKKFSCPMLRTDLKTAEMIKYASNNFLSMKVSFINEIGNICKRLGIDSYKVAEGMSLDHRISPNFLNSGIGWGGSCFPKDSRSLIQLARNIGYKPILLGSSLGVNESQPLIFLNIARSKIGSFRDKRTAVMGLAFKADTDDMRDSQATPIVNKLIEEGAIVKAYDPRAMNNAREIFGDKIEYASSPTKALEGVGIALILTDWKEFENLNFEVMENKIVIDGRNIVKNREGIDYEGICW